MCHAHAAAMGSGVHTSRGRERGYDDMNAALNPLPPWTCVQFCSGCVQQGNSFCSGCDLNVAVMCTSFSTEKAERGI